ncbi:MAG: hypothetical protein GY744_10810 [Gammaproteobacteria bacterium]|nr:hypothetical protein [Gammaproteobacteria bacterium]
MPCVISYNGVTLALIQHDMLYSIRVFLLFYCCYLISGSLAEDVSQQQWLLLILLGVFFTALPHTLFACSLLHLKAKNTEKAN